MDPVTTAALIGGGAQILGGLLGKKKSGADTTAYNIALQEESSLRHEKNSFDQKMALAKTHGLHPLSVLGVPTANFSPAILNTGTKEQSADYSAIGSGVERMAQSFVKPPEDPTNERIANANVRIAEATANKAEFDALRSQWTTEDLLRGQPGNPPAARISNDGSVTANLAARQAGVTPGFLSGSGVKIEQTIAPPHPNNLGHTLGADQSFQTMYDKDGKAYSMPNPSVYNPDIEQFGTFHALSQKYGADKALQIMAVLEQAPVAGGLIAGAGYAASRAYQYFAEQRAKALKNRTTRQTWSKSRGPSRYTGPRNE